MKTMTIKAQFHSYWHIGTGRGAGKHLDALVEKDESGLPYVSGKTIKGLLRDAAFKLDTWQGTNNVDLLFGSRTNDEGESQDETKPGILRFSNLELEEKEFLSQTGQENLVSNLYQVMTNTAIDQNTGSAKENSLRTMEVVIPVTLKGTVQIINPIGEGAHQDAQRNFKEIDSQLSKYASLVTHIGANKNRGFGRVTLQINELGQEG